MAFPYYFEILSGSGTLDFFGGRVIKSYLKPEEVDQAIVSKGLDFNLSKDYREGWSVFCTKLKRLVTQLDNSGQVTEPVSEAFFTKDRVRLVVCSNGPLNRGPFSRAEELEEITLPMKVKLISDIPLSVPQSFKEQGCLYRLTKICGPQNARIVIQDLGDEQLYPRLEEPLQLEWNEDTLSWEADAQVTYQTINLVNFGTTERGFYSPLGVVQLTLNDAGVGQVLEQIYSKPGVDNCLLREMLEEGTFSDLGIISDTDKEPIQCHRVQIAAASRVFADMLKNSWKEATTQVVKLPESREAILALLHFIYYGGTQRILDAGMNVVLELLQAGHKYGIPTLVDVTAFVLWAKRELDDEWWSVDGAVDLFSLARNVDGDLWNMLCRLCHKFLERQELDKLKACPGYLNMFQIAAKLGPEFKSVLAMEQMHEPQSETQLKRNSLPNVPEGMSKADVELIFDFICYSCIQDCTLDTIVGVVVLADYCGRVIPQSVVHLIKNLANGHQQRYIDEKISVDFLVELFCKSRRKTGMCWEHLKIMAVRKLKELLTKQSSETEASEKYMEMFKTDFQAAAEFTKLCMME